MIFASGAKAPFTFEEYMSRLKRRPTRQIPDPECRPRQSQKDWLQEIDEDELVEKNFG
jgi:hypothetical protein